MNNRNSNIKHMIKHSWMAIFLIIFYIPIIVVMMFAFNDGKSIFSWQGFSTRWFTELFQDQSFVNALLVTLIVSTTSTFISVIIGTMAAIGLHNGSKTWFTKSLFNITNYPIFIADVILGVSLMIIFILLGFNFGIITMILGHVMFCTPYVIVAIIPKLKQVNPEIIDASFDLGASPFQTIRKVIVPIIKPGIIAGSAMAFAISFDDFIITYFIGGDKENISVWIYNLKKLVPIVNAFSLFLILFVALFFMGKTYWERLEYVKNNQEEMWMAKTFKKECVIKFKNTWNKENKKSIKKYFSIKHQINNDIEIKKKVKYLWESKNKTLVGDENDKN